MPDNVLMLEREYVRMETTETGKSLAVQKKDYDRILFLSEVYGKSGLIPFSEMVFAIPVLEVNKQLEIAPLGGTLIPMRDLQLSKETVGPAVLQ